MHPTYLTIPYDQIHGEALKLATDPAYGTDTTYYMIPTQNLPLLDPLRAIPFVGNPSLADLFQPDLRVIVNLGYGNPDLSEGWSPGPANVPTTFGLFPTNVSPNDVLQSLVSGTQQGSVTSSAI